jgi:hypothetical protein
MAGDVKYSKPTFSLITVPDPEELAMCNHAEVGGILQWRSESLSYPEFDIEFVGPVPYDGPDGDVLTGSVENPIIKKATKEGIYQYNVVHKCEGKPPIRKGMFYSNIHPCIGC